MTTQRTPKFAQNGQVHLPLQAVVGSTLTLTIPVTAICPNCAPLLEAAKAAHSYLVINIAPERPGRAAWVIEHLRAAIEAVERRNT